jgi:peptidase M48-like protein
MSVMWPSALVLSACVATAACSAPPPAREQTPAPRKEAPSPVSRQGEPRAVRPKSAPREPIAEPPLQPTICGRTDLSYRQVQILPGEARIFVQPKVLQVPLATLQAGTLVTLVQPEGGWFLVEFNDTRWGKRVGFVECSRLSIIEARASIGTPPSVPNDRVADTPKLRRDDTPSIPTTRADVRPPLVSCKGERISGYLEWRRDDTLIVEGQRVTWHRDTRRRLARWAAIDQLPLGIEIAASGKRTADGQILADEIQAKPNGLAMFERETAADANKIEELCLREGTVFELEDRRLRRGGAVIRPGADVERVRRVLTHIVPPYLRNTPLRVYVVDTPEWNAHVRPNGSIWVNRGLLADLADDDELSIVLGHELAHFTHEHSRRFAKKGFWIQLAMAGASGAIATIDNPSTRDAVTQLGNIGVQAWANSYSRGFEEQADRVGLRYAYEGGFDVSRAPTLWRRALARQGEWNRVANFLFGSHPRPSERLRDVEREIALNYSGQER